MSAAAPQDERRLPGASSSASAPPPAAAVFDALVRTHYGRLCNFAVRFVDGRDAAEDIVQDVFARIWQRQTEFRLDDPLPYLYQAVRNRAANYARDQGIRDRWRRHVVDEAATDPAAAPSTAPDAARAAAVAETADAIDRAIDALPPRCRLIFTMSREQDLTYAEIARLLGLSIKTVETQMGRALKSLRAQLADYLALAAAVGGARWLG